MKRSPMKTRTSPLRRTPLPRRTRIRPRNPERLARLEARNYGEHAKWVRRLPCTGCRPTLFRLDAGFENRLGAAAQGRIVSEASHVRARGMGGCGGDRTELVPHCSLHHRAFEADRARFEAAYGPQAPIAAALWAMSHPCSARVA